MKQLFRKYSFPGLKRWLFSAILGLLTISFGVALILKAHPITVLAQSAWGFMAYVADKIPPTVSGIAAISIGIFLLLYAFFRANKQVLSLVAPNESSLFETLDRAMMESRGIKIVTIGGGTGLSNMLKGLKTYSGKITAVVTVADDGGSSGRLRKALDIVPPGDIRNCIAALSHDDEVITQLFQYRFDEDAPQDLKNHSFGNLFLTALVELGGSNNMADAVSQACRILKARGSVLPVSNEPMNLIAEMEDGRIIEGESNIPNAGGKIAKLKSSEPRPEILPEVIQAINEAEIIVLGPGSLYTSIVPNLLFPELVDAIAKSNAPKIYISNVMTQPGETGDFTASDHVKAIIKQTQELCPDYINLIDYVIVNNEMPFKKQLDKYKADDQYPVELDYHELKELGLKIYPTNLLQKGNLVRHNPYKLAKAIMKIYEKELRTRDKEIRQLIKAN